jgi:hypothetical protein
VLNDYTLASDLDRQSGDVPVGLRKILLSMIHGTHPRAVSAAQLKIPNVPHYCNRVLQLNVGQLHLIHASTRTTGCRLDQ